MGSWVPSGSRNGWQAQVFSKLTRDDPNLFPTTSIEAIDVISSYVFVVQKEMKTTKNVEASARTPLIQKDLQIVSLTVHRERHYRGFAKIFF